MYKNKYYNDNKDDILGKKKDYYQKNKESIIKKTREYYNNNKDKKKIYKPTPEKKLIYNKTYYDKNKSKIYDNLYKDVYCSVCDRNYKNYYMSKHKKSKKHHKNRLKKDTHYKKENDILMLKNQLNDIQNKLSLLSV